MLIEIKTPKYKLKVECLYDFIETKDVVIKKDLFGNMCKEGCPNYGKKFCCPPFSKTFNSKEKYLLVVLFRMDLNQLNESEYMKVKIANAVLKPRLEKIMRILETKYGGRFYSNGACRLCKKCGERCNHPDKMRFSLESTGVDCNKLVKGVFGFDLEWYRNRKSPKYTAVVCGLPLNEKFKDQKLLSNLLEVPMEGRK